MEAEQEDEEKSLCGWSPISIYSDICSTTAWLLSGRSSFLDSLRSYFDCGAVESGNDTTMIWCAGILLGRSAIPETPRQWKELYHYTAAWTTFRLTKTTTQHGFVLSTALASMKIMPANGLSYSQRRICRTSRRHLMPSLNILWAWERPCVVRFSCQLWLLSKANAKRRNDHSLTKLVGE